MPKGYSNIQHIEQNSTPDKKNTNMGWARWSLLYTTTCPVIGIYEIHYSSYKPYWIWRHHSKTCPTTWCIWACWCVCHWNQNRNAACCMLRWCIRLVVHTACPIWPLSKQLRGYSIRSIVSVVTGLYIPLMHRCLSPWSRTCPVEVSRHQIV